MRILPDSPSVDFLRKEAKDLLAALRESSPEASLADAQRALAAEYGVRDWIALKPDVERRAAEAMVAPDGFADALATVFDLGRAVSTAPVSFTPMGRCWSITTDRGRWLAVTVYEWITEAHAEVGFQLRNAAVASGIVAPAPVRSAQGRLIETVHGQSWRVHEWIEVGPSPVTPTPTAVARRIGTIYGTLHAMAIPSEAPVNPYLTSRRPEADWEGLVGLARSAHKPWAGQLKMALPKVFDLRAITADIDSDEFILCNCNLIPEHVRMGHHDELVVTEWDFAGSLTPELELGYALVHWASQPSINRAAISALRDGYARSSGAWPDLNLASFAVAVTGWLNWTYNTVCEAIDPSDGDRAAFAEGETVNLLNRPMTRSALHELLAAAQA